MKKLLILLLCLPFIGIGQEDADRDMCTLLQETETFNWITLSKSSNAVQVFSYFIAQATHCDVLSNKNVRATISINPNIDYSQMIDQYELIEIYIGDTQNTVSYSFSFEEDFEEKPSYEGNKFSNNIHSREYRDYKQDLLNWKNLEKKKKYYFANIKKRYNENVYVRVKCRNGLYSKPIQIYHTDYKTLPNPLVFSFPSAQILNDYKVDTTKKDEVFVYYNDVSIPFSFVPIWKILWPASMPIDYYKSFAECVGLDGMLVEEITLSREVPKTVVLNTWESLAHSISGGREGEKAVYGIEYNTEITNTKYIIFIQKTNEGLDVNKLELINKLFELKENGILTQEEFDQKKKKILNE